MMRRTLADRSFTIPPDATLPARPLRRERGRTHLLRRLLLDAPPHRPRPRLVARGAGGMGGGSRPALRGDLESAEMGAEDPADVRRQGARAAPDRSLEPPLRRALGAAH